MITFDQQEQFDGRTVELFTGVKSATLRQWETRGVYVCELRRHAEFELRILRAPDTPDRVPRAKDVLRRLQRGWRSYVIADLIRITAVARLIELGVAAHEAGFAAQSLTLPEAEPNSQPSGRELVRLFVSPDSEEEYVVFSPVTRYLAQVRDKRPPEDPQLLPLWRNAFRVVAEAAGERGAVVLNLSAIRRVVLDRLEGLSDDD